MPDGRTHFVGDDCPGGHRIEDGGEQLTPEQEVKGVIYLQKLERLEALEEVADELQVALNHQPPGPDFTRVCLVCCYDHWEAVNEALARLRETEKA